MSEDVFPLDHESRDPEWWWQNLLIPREHTLEIVQVVCQHGTYPRGTEILTFEELLEVMAITLSYVLAEPMMESTKSVLKAIETYKTYLINAQKLQKAGFTIPAPKIADMNREIRTSARRTMQADAVRGAPNKTARDALVARLLGFLAFATQTDVDDINGELAENFLNRVLSPIREAFRVSDSFLDQELSKGLYLPTTIKHILSTSRSRKDDVTYAKKVFWTVMLWLHFEKISVEIKDKKHSKLAI